MIGIGMNVQLGPFLYIMPELDAYYSFRQLITAHIPAYTTKNLSGVHKGITIADRLLNFMDPELHTHILSKIPNLSIFAVRFIMTLMANVQPLSELILLWDILLAIGCHCGLVVFCIHLMLMRERLLHENSSYKISMIIEQGQLDSARLNKMLITIMPLLPEELLEELVSHCILIKP